MPKSYVNLTEEQQAKVDEAALQAAIDQLLKIDPSRKAMLDDHMRKGGLWDAG